MCRCPHCSLGKSPPRTHQLLEDMSGGTWNCVNSNLPWKMKYSMVMKKPGSPVKREARLGVTLQNLSTGASRPVKGCPAGSPGALVADGSNRLISSLSVG